ncbi:hypothetical protein [Lentzea sp. NBRC 102530]|uniref:hypothetical protein n=1 Tax=Lentzea sp. NBRC 102530 TaxID=3032201 RepID=UPI0024A44D58|nr:hypothetical protein [Lentzea sp. NBRC 102530]GLY48384.1 hypothetical protein Lesp01_20400 [Lentzea sp. NBRC 102530]
MRAVVGLVTSAVLFAGCSAKRVETPEFDSASTPVSTPSMKPGGSATPVKYTAENTRSCADVRQQVGADLPDPQPDGDQQPGAGSWARTCTYKTAEQAVVFAIRSWENTDDATGFTSGNDNAKRYFADRTSSWEKDGGVGIGSDARWREPRASACALEALDENAVLTVALTGGAEGEQCRTAVRELAKKFYAAMQP